VKCDSGDAGIGVSSDEVGVIELQERGECPQFHPLTILESMKSMTEDDSKGK